MTIIPIIIPTSSGPPTSHSRSFLDEKSGARIDVTVRTSDPVVALERFQEIDRQLPWIQDEKESDGTPPLIAIPFIAGFFAFLAFIAIGFVAIILESAGLVDLPYDGFKLNVQFSLLVWLALTILFIWHHFDSRERSEEDEG